MACVRLFPVEHGAAAVRWARMALEEAVQGPRLQLLPAPPPGLAEPRGAFVTLTTTAGELRGCTGFVEARAPLHEVVARAATLAARDPRFSPVRAEELERILVEVSILSLPVAVHARAPEDLAAAVRVGDHGLVVARGRDRGVLLPQVAVEHGFTAEQFLGACCVKAGLDAEAWRDAGLQWAVFGAQVFAEREPGGAVAMVGAEDARPEVA